MTKSELIKNFARNSGVHDSEARVFFEIFLRKLVSRLAIKQSIKIPDIGYFELKKDYIKPKEDKVELDVISFSEYKESGEQLIFNIPDETEQSSSLDSYFSPSFGKPIIPLEGVNNTEIFVSHSGIEYEKILESKADKLLTETEITEATEEPLMSQSIPEEEFHKPEKKDINWKSVPIQSEEEPQSEMEDRSSVEDSESISWNFGEGLEDDDKIDLNKPVQPSLQELEDKKVEITSDNTEFKDEEGIPENYPKDNVSVLDEDEQKYPEEISQPQYEAEAGEVPLEQEREDIVKTGEPNELNEYKTPDPGEIKPSLFSINDYERVEPLIAPLLVLDKELESEEDIPSDKDEEYIFDEEGYARVTPKVASLLRVKEGKEEIFESSSNKTDIPVEEDVSKKYDEINDTSEVSKPKRTLVVIGILASLIVIIGGIYLYTYYFGENSPDTVIAPPKVKDRSEAVIIERSYDYPVTYPYNKNTIVGLFDGINPDLLKTALVEEQPQIGGGIPEIDTYEARPSKLVKGYIFQYEDFYAVQVSSWKSFSIAQSEMLKYKNGGLNAFIEEAQVKGSKYYRVRVGFKTLEEVEAYLAK